VILRVDENIYFANTEAIRRFVFDALDQADAPHALILAMTSVSYVDSSGVALLERMDEDLAARGVVLHLAEVKGPVADRLTRVDGLAPMFAERVHLSLDRAVRCLSPAGGSASALGRDSSGDAGGLADPTT
jgi:SulP family sulfate permease